MYNDCEMLQFPWQNDSKGFWEMLQAPSRLQVPDLLRRFDVRRLPDVRFGREEVQAQWRGIRRIDDT